MRSMLMARKQGFTLAELLVVIGILAILMGLAVPVIGMARKSAAKKEVAFQVQTLTAALAGYQADFGDYPATDWEHEYELKGNGLFLGIESLVAHLSCRKKNGPYLKDFKEQDFQNLDGDQNVGFHKRLGWVFGDAQVRELVDRWGSPFVYFHNRDYGKTFKVRNQLDGKDAKEDVHASMSKSLKNYQGLSTYQIWSVGPDGKNQNGDDDDVASWE